MRTLGFVFQLSYWADAKTMKAYRTSQESGREISFLPVIAVTHQTACVNNWQQDDAL